VTDYQFDILELIDTIIAYLQSSPVAEKLSEGDPISLKINEFMKFNGIHKEHISNVVKLAAIRLGETDSVYAQNIRKLIDKI
jgi:hypothetical protein